MTGARVHHLDPGGFCVDPDRLHAHAARVDGHAARVTEIATAAQPLGLHAYGLVGQAFAGTVQQTAQACSAGVASLAALVQDFGDRLRRVAEEYRAADEAAAAGFRGIR